MIVMRFDSAMMPSTNRTHISEAPTCEHLRTTTSSDMSEMISTWYS